MNPLKLKFFFTRMIRNSGFRIFYKCLYDALRLMFLRIFNEPAPVVNQLEKELNEGVEKVYQEEKNALEKVEIEVVIRRERVAYMEEVREDWKLKERSRWREGIPQLPVWKRRGGAAGKKRSRSRSKSRPVSAKRRRLNKKGRKSSVLVPVQPAPLGARSVSGNCAEDGSVVEVKVGDGSEKPKRAGSVLDNDLNDESTVGVVDSGADR